MKMKLLYLVLIVALVNFSIPNSKAQASNWLDGWGYRKNHILLQTSDVTTDFQVNITCFYGFGIDDLSNIYFNQKCLIDFNDIRFTESDGNTLIIPYLQNKFNGFNATYWLKIQWNLSLQNVLIYVYYGNNDATSLSQGASYVFIDVINNTVLSLPMDEGIGSTVYDKSGNGHNGTISGATWINGKFGKALSFNGVNASVNLNSQILSSSNFTYAFWVKNAKMDGSYGLFIAPASGGCWVGYHKTVNTHFYAGTTINIDSGYSLSSNDGIYHFCCLTFDGVTMKFYVDASEKYSTTTVGTITPSGNTFIGKNNDGNRIFVDGLDEINIFSQVLNLTQITILEQNYGDMYILSGSVCVRKWSNLFEHGVWGDEEEYEMPQNTLTQNMNEFFDATLFSSESYLSYISLLIIFAILAFVSTKTFMGFLASILVSLALLSKYIMLLSPEGNFAYHILIVLFNLIFSFIFLGLSRRKR